MAAIISRAAILPLFSRVFLFAACAGTALLTAPCPSSARSSDIAVAKSGALPVKGMVVIRSGMAWMDETSPLFQNVRESLAKELTARGMTVVSVKPSALESMPETPLPQGSSTSYPGTMPKTGSNEAVTGTEQAQKASELGREGKLPQLKLRSYTVPAKDTDLPASVRAVAPPNVTRALYARSQQQGMPVVTSFAVPGRLPKELAEDATIADYAVVARFAAVRAWALAPSPVPGGPPGTGVAASTVKGLGALGFGNPAAPAPPGRDTYGTPGGYVRGYEGAAPNDFWHRDSDFYQRDYQFKYGPQPNYATPPTGLSPSPDRSPGATGLPASGHETASFSEWHLLILDAFALAPMKNNKPPEPVWRAVARRPGSAQSLVKSLPEMAQALGSTKGEQAL